MRIFSVLWRTQSELFDIIDIKKFSELDVQIAKFFAQSKYSEKNIRDGRFNEKIPKRFKNYSDTKCSF